MRRLPFVLALCASCIPYDPPAYHPSYESNTECHLDEPYTGALKLPGVTDITKLSCTAENKSHDYREICAQPVVAVRETGALYTSHRAMCSGELAPGGKETYQVTLDLRRELCRMDRGGCIVRAYDVESNYEVDPGVIVAFARQVEPQATELGRDRPTTTECDALVEGWSTNAAFLSYGPYLHARNGDSVRAFCLAQSRVGFDCLRSAQTSAQADACR